MYSTCKVIHMIPTRITQQYREGSVVGFDPLIGSIIIARNRAIYNLSVNVVITYNDLGNLESLANRDLSRASIFYRYPSISSLAVTLKSVNMIGENFNPNRFPHVKWHTHSLQLFLSTSVVERETNQSRILLGEIVNAKHENKRKLQYCSLELYDIDHAKYTTKYATIPVICINGENCDSD